MCNNKVLHRRAAAAASALLCLILLCCLFVSAEPERKVRSFFVEYGTGTSQYYEGDVFDPTGYIGTVIYSDGTTETLLHDQMTYTVQTPLTADTAVTFSCSKTNITAGLPLTVTRIAKLLVEGTPVTSYRAGEDCFDPTGLSFTAEYSDGTTRPVPADAVRCTPAPDALLSSDITSVTFSYGSSDSARAEIPISVAAVQQLTVTRVPSRGFYEGTAAVFRDGELEVKALFAGDSSPRVVRNYSVLNADAPVTVNENGKMVYNVLLDSTPTSFDVEVIPVSSFLVTSSSGIVDYYYDTPQPIRTGDITVLAVYDDSSSFDITNQVQFTVPEVITATERPTAVFADLQIPLDSVLHIHDAEIVVIKEPQKTDYKEGETFLPNGFLAYIQYDDGKTYNPAESEFSVQAASPLTIAEDSAVFSWMGIEHRVPLTVRPEKELTLRVVTPPEKVRYLSGQPLDLTGLTVEAVYDGSSDPVVLSSAIYTTVPAEGDPLTENITRIRIQYALSQNLVYETELPIEVEPRTAKGLLLINEPTKLIYNEGDRFNSTGMSVGIIYNDGSIEPLERGYTVDQDLLILSSDEPVQTVPVTVSYNGMSCILNLTVNSQKLRSIGLIANPTKREYNAGDTFRPDGVIVAAYYENAPETPVVLPAELYTFSPAGKLKSTDKAVTFTFRGQSVNCPIAVNGGRDEESSEATTPITQTPPETSPGSGTTTPITRKNPPVTSPISTGPDASETTPHSVVGGGGTGTIMILWIVIIAIILVGIVALIIYYRRNFT